ncbi:MAG: hypothetical protein KDB27_07990 [Planctomycetales bacterium]|nr:hypothetical protein [Planctomycetales bacterium]
MWKCPNCEEQIEDNFDTCWNCGTQPDGTTDSWFARNPDAPAAADQSKEVFAELSNDANRPARNGFAYSAFADFALLVGQACAMIGCVSAIIYGVRSMMAESWFGGSLMAPLLFFLSLAHFVVFSRVSRL